MHGFEQAITWLPLSLILLMSSMFFWFRDVVSEGRAKSLLYHLLNLSYKLNTTRAIDPKDVQKALLDYNSKTPNLLYSNNKEFAHYLAGLLEGNGHIVLPSLSIISLNRVLNPRIVFNSHINNLGLYAFIQSNLGGVGRFQITGDKLIRYIIGDKKSIIMLSEMLNGKLRSPKNKRFNDMIKFINNKYSLTIPISILDVSNMSSNSWLTGFIEADGHFGVKIIESKPKSDTRKRYVSENISLKFVLSQHSYDKPNKSSMLPLMQTIASFLSCELKTYSVKHSNYTLTLSVYSQEKLKLIIDYIKLYPLIGSKASDFLYWVEVYDLIINKEHLTKEGRLKIRCIAHTIKHKRI